MFTPRRTTPGVRAGALQRGAIAPARPQASSARSAISLSYNSSRSCRSTHFALCTSSLRRTSSLRLKSMGCSRRLCGRPSARFFFFFGSSTVVGAAFSTSSLGSAVCFLDTMVKKTPQAWSLGDFFTVFFKACLNEKTETQRKKTAQIDSN